MIKKIKENPLYTLIFLFGMILLSYQIFQVVMYADDYSLGCYIIGKNGFQAAIDYFIYNYQHWGGGFTGLIVISILTIGFWLWRYIEIFMMFSLVLLTVKFVHIESQEKKEWTLFLTFVFYFLLNVCVSRETIYWLDGSMAYVLSTLQVMLFSYLFYTRVNYKKMRKKYDVVLLPLTAFFGGWSSAQSGAMVVLAAFIILLFSKYVNHRRITKFQLLNFFLSIIGYLIFYFAPGNSERMSTFEEFSKLGVFQKIQVNVVNIYSGFFNFQSGPFTSLPMYVFILIVFLTTMTLHLLKKEKNKTLKNILYGTCLIHFCYFVFAILVKTGMFELEKYCFHFYDLSKEFHLYYLIPYGIGTLLLLGILIQSIYLSLKEKKSIILLLVCIAFGSRIVMLMSPTHPYRTFLISVSFLIITIVYLYKMLDDNQVNWYYPLAMIPFFFGIRYGMLIVCLYFFLEKMREQNSIVPHPKYAILALFFILALGNYTRITVHYRSNRYIHEENLRRIAEYQKNPNEEKRILLIRPDEQYGFTPIAGIGWVEHDMKFYFQLENETEFVFEDEFEK